jgi:hypothetical protein
MIYFPRTQVSHFVDSFNRGSFQGQRVGQAFYTFMKLEKIVSEKEFCDKLYELDGEKAWNFIYRYMDSLL